MFGVWTVSYDLIYGVDLQKVPFIFFCHPWLFCRDQGDDTLGHLRRNAHPMFPLFLETTISHWKKTFQNCNPLDFKFYLGKATKVTWLNAGLLQCKTAFSLAVFFATLIFSNQHKESTKIIYFYLSIGAYLQENILKVN